MNKEDATYRGNVEMNGRSCLPQTVGEEVEQGGRYGIVEGTGRRQRQFVGRFAGRQGVYGGR